MANMTKKALENSLKKLLKEKPFDKITIADITEDCGISRMAFYYHFQDIIDLVRWTLISDAEKLVKDNKTYSTWQKGYLAVFETIKKDKAFILNIYHHVPREYITEYLYSITLDLLNAVVEEKVKELKLKVRDEDKLFVANFFKYSFVGLVLDWIDKGMEMDASLIVDKLDSIIHGTIQKALMNAAY